MPRADAAITRSYLFFKKRREGRKKNQRADCGLQTRSLLIGCLSIAASEQDAAGDGPLRWRRFPRLMGSVPGSSAASVGQSEQRGNRDAVCVCVMIDGNP